MISNGVNKRKILQTPFTKGGVKKPELIAPAGNLEKMKTAFAFGADAVYAGIPDFSLRVRINDFTVKSLDEAIKYAHSPRWSSGEAGAKKKKIYVTINIFAHEKHIKKLPAYVKKLKKMKPDGFIVSDPGVMRIIRKEWPSAKIHLSTQANCTNKEAAKFWHDQGFKRVVLGRETTLKEIKEIRKRVPKLEIETFVHGAMCMAYSGRCFLSKLFVNRSANQGDCVQPCRWEYNIKAKGHDEVLELVEEAHGSYILNSNDMCLIKRIPEMIDAGISSFKIEGRAKSIYYLACIVGSYRKAIDLIYNKKTLKVKKKKELDFLYKELSEKLYHRGYTEGFMFEKGKMAQNLDNSHKVPKWEFCGVVLKNVKPQNFASVRAKVHNSLKVGDNIEIVMPGYDIIKMKLKKMIDAETGENIKEAHGGQGRTVIIETNREVPEYSVLRRFINKKNNKNKINKK